MKRALVASSAALASFLALSASTPTPLDPPRDPVHPARSEVLHIPSAGLEINGLAYIASGQGVHPTLVICHGWPGNEKNLDLAQAVRRAGWNAVTFNYRGSWGSPGEFHFSQVPEDAAAVVAWLRRPEVAAKLGVDTHRIAMAGHSMGGWATARAAALDSTLLGAVLIAPADMGRLGKMTRADVVKAAADDAETLVTSPEKMADELIAQSDAFALTQSAAGLAKIPVLVLTADDGLAARAGALVAAIRTHGGAHVQTLHFTTDHSFNDSRLALQSSVINWLQTLPSVSLGDRRANSAGDAMTDNSRLSVMLNEDQADRISWGQKKIDADTILERDERRRAEVRQMLATNEVRTAHDFYCAAVIFHHGQTIDHYRLATSLAWVSMTIEPTNKDYAYMSASTWDRLMMKQGKPQWYGTKCRHESGQPGTDQLYPVDETAVTDGDRARFDLKPLAVMRAHIGESIRLSGADATC
jgi:uncharacterized protein